MHTNRRQEWLAFGLLLLTAIVGCRRGLHSEAAEQAEQEKAAIAAAPDLFSNDWDDAKDVDCWIQYRPGVVPPTPGEIVAGAEPDVSGGINCKFSVSGRLLPLTVRFPGKDKDAPGDVEVMQGGRVLQIIRGRETPVFPHEPEFGLVHSIDADFDGYQDLELTNAKDTASSDFYLYDPAHRQFVYEKTISGLEDTRFNASRKQVEATCRARKADGRCTSIYQFENGAYREIERSEWTGMTEDVYALKDGKMVRAGSVPHKTSQ